MLRRPPGEGGPRVHQRKLILAFAVLLLACIPLVDGHQQRPIVEVHRQSEDAVGRRDTNTDREPIRPAAALGEEWADDDEDKLQRRAFIGNVESKTKSKIDSDRLPHQYLQHQRRHNILNNDDASAVATLAPAQSVRAPPSRHRSVNPPTGGSGISTPPRARSLEEWEVEDFILLATVDGDLYASDRKTGAQLWHLEVDQPMVETVHHRLNTSGLDDDHLAVDHYIWAVEPSQDGTLYIWVPGTPEPLLISTGLTMKKLVEELSPLANDNPPVIYTGTKKTTMITLDAATGRVLKWFGAGGSHINENESCLRPDALYDLGNEECSSTGTLTLGRTEYEVAITGKDGRDIAKLKYSEWSPNNFDRDLVSIYRETLDNRYHSSFHDGRVYAFDEEDHPMFTHKFSAPVARVFDVCRPWGVTRDKNPDLLVLPQPVPAPKDSNDDVARKAHVFLNQTDTGSWYALSGRFYPLIVDAPPALTSLPGFWEQERQWHLLSPNQKAGAMVGRHNFNKPSGRGQVYRPSLPGGAQSQAPAEVEHEIAAASEVSDEPLIPIDGAAIVNKVMAVPHSLMDHAVNLIQNPLLILAAITFLLFYRKDLIRWCRSKSRKAAKQLQWSVDDQRSEAGDSTTEVSPEPLEETPAPTTASGDAPPKQDTAHREAPPPPTLPPKEAEPTTAEPPVVADPQTAPAPQPERSDDKADSLTDGDGSSVQKTESENSGEKKKAKSHRGRRGGVKHKKGPKKRETSVSRDDEPPATTVDDAVKNAQRLGNSPKLEPDVVTVTNDMQSVTGPVIKLGNIEVDTEDQLGTGSNGTLVFAGKFDGREVAVKRMLIQFYDIASQETRLLRESDDHPNVIRYYAQEFRDGFLYIALERCAASLADVVEKPSRFSKLAQAGKADLPGVLYQITNGINHLHQLRIVHRDLKPQNILVNMDKNERPRLLVSDFGLCKKLEGGQSSFGATTGRAAGTSGWRAPELLVDDDRELTEASINSGSGTILNGDMTSGRRATRSIDIFSLGLVFFYVLTNGQHPFDCGDRYMREVNIRKGNYNLTPLDVLGDFAAEAKDLVSSMLNDDPKQRPNTKEVMAHPFFWSAKKRLAFLCDVSDYFEKEIRDPPSPHLQELEAHASEVISGDFLKKLPPLFVESLGKQRKYTGTRLLDLLRALRNKKNHYDDMTDSLKRSVGPLPEGYLAFWTFRFPELLLACWNIVWDVGWDQTDRFREYYEPANL
ncbi:serine/threonine-protein kinase/endoribonuclease IRE1 [Plectosphaerella plurivora]|uniref:non-specific serine/threonine protein kinase n=1 Tax=Plectosphaerella plurivora TaxID=936078 RepID=A0A9P9A830_9PEZI|nr:serine/threonine-protein kinase/endoribonuclease IRE1 [Plectosphaerella plurivora]